MIIGSCPYEGCDGDVWISISDKTPCFSKDACEKCNKIFWTLHSRLQPKSWTDEHFRAEVADVDEEKHSIQTKNGLTMDDIYFS